ncbi:hypothetical protein GGF32_000368, partial [Allomyces javanicus]
MGYQKRVSRTSGLHGSLANKQQLKARAYTPILFRDRHFQRMSSPTPASLLQRSSDFVVRVHNIVEDLVMTGTVAPTRFVDEDAKFFGIDPASILSFVDWVVKDESDLLRCNVIALHLRCSSLLGQVAYDYKDVLRER